MTFDERYDEGYERAIDAMGRQIDRLLQEAHGLRQENALLQKEIAELQQEIGRLWTKMSRCPYDWSEQMSTSTITVPPEQVLDLELPVNQANAATVREYLKALLVTAWGQNFGHSSPWRISKAWKAPIEEALIGAKLVAGALDEQGFVDRVDNHEVDALIRSAIEAL